MARWQWVLVGLFAFITYSVFVALIVSLLEQPAPLPTPTRTLVPTFTPTGTPQPTPILMPARPATITPTVTATATVTPTSSTRTHTVQRGETLAAIAKAYGVTVKEVMELNGLDDRNTIKVGQELLIPSPP